MQNKQTATPAAEALIDYIMHMTPAQCDKLVERLPLLEQLAKATPNELLFTEHILNRICGKVSA